MRVNVYVSLDEEPQCFGLIAADKPVSLLPETGRWKYLRDADTCDLALPEAIEEEIGRHGFWASGRSRWPAGWRGRGEASS